MVYTVNELALAIDALKVMCALEPEGYHTRAQDAYAEAIEMDSLITDGRILAIMIAQLLAE